MKEEQDYIHDIAEIRSMMERSSKFLSLSGWAGIMAGIYALAATWIAYSVFDFYPNRIFYHAPGLNNVIWLALGILILALVTAVYFSRRKAHHKNERIWNATSRRLLASMAVPLVSGGILMSILLAKGMAGLLAPLALLFYGLALYNASKFTFDAVKFLGLIQIVLGLISSYFINYGLPFWAIGFGIVHIVYGIYIHFRYEQ